MYHTHMRHARDNLGYRPKCPLVAPPIEVLTERSRARKRAGSPPPRASGAPELKRARAPPTAESMSYAPPRSTRKDHGPVTVNGRSADKPQCITPPDTALPDSDLVGFISMPPPARFPSVAKLQEYLTQYAREDGYMLTMVPQSPLPPDMEESFVFFHCADSPAHSGTGDDHEHRILCPFHVLAYNTEREWNFTVVDPHHAHPRRARASVSTQPSSTRSRASDNPAPQPSPAQPYAWQHTPMPQDADIPRRQLGRLESHSRNAADTPRRRNGPTMRTEVPQDAAQYPIHLTGNTGQQHFINGMSRDALIPPTHQPPPEVPHLLEDMTAHPPAFPV